MTAAAEARIAAESAFRAAQQQTDTWARVIALTHIEGGPVTEGTQKKFREVLATEQDAYRTMCAAQRAAR